MSQQVKPDMLEQHILKQHAGLRDRSRARQGRPGGAEEARQGKTTNHN